MIQRRVFLKAGLATASAVAAPHVAAQAGERVVVIGGGFGGATAARYLRRLNPALQVTLVEPASEFVMCPMSNRVIHGGLQLRDISRPYSRFVANNGLRWVRARADSIDLSAREVRAGDELEIAQGPVLRTVKVLGVSAQRGPAPQAALLYSETEASVAQRLAQAERRRLAPEPALALTQGRPTKRQRRDMDALHGQDDGAAPDWNERWSASLPPGATRL